ncbi:site-2 protease family protein [Rhodopseudomonas sp. HC1]|uniref:site-2 protease family protein n=1 Tax=Rhodopseudomonas infernalis TaxID=2897386 RepID=UPI001EE8C7B2|nr:site-2 protease family protein [Rhodopseudomonas infernalis]MCG6203050.1 site-2 protease family protein [Rhodopseudomonas infernalis]
MYSDIAFSLGAIYGLLLIHELGHLAAARAVGLRVHRLTLGVGPQLFGFHGPAGLYCTIALLPIGSACVLGDSGAVPRRSANQTSAATSIGKRAIIYAAGPVCNLGLAAVLVLGASWTHDDFSLSWALQADAAAITLIAGTSLLIGLFNLLPIPPLDGGWLALLVLEACRGAPLDSSSAARLQRVGSGLIAGASVLLIGSFALRYWHLL